jgi:hypothetical protein
MNKSIIGWIFAVLVLFGCMGVIAVGALLGFSMNSDLTKTKADLATANQAATQQSADLEKVNSQVAVLETKFNNTVCKTTVEIDYSTKKTAMDTILAYANGLGYSAYGADEKLFFDINGFTDLWVVTILADKSGTYGKSLDFFLYTDSKTTYFSEKGCWVQAPV